MNWVTLTNAEYKLYDVFKPQISTGIMYFAAQSCAKFGRFDHLVPLRYTVTLYSCDI